MILLWGYLAGILPVTFGSAYFLGRDGWHHDVAARQGLGYGLIWPLALVVAPTRLAVIWVAKLGGRQYDAAQAQSEANP